MSQRGLDRDSRSRRRPRVSLDSRENLDSVKKLDRDISILSRHQRPDQKISIEIKNFVEIWKFRCFSTVCLDLDREVHGFLYFLVEISGQISTASWQISTASRQILTNLDKNLDATKSRLKSLDFKNLDREKKKVDLDVMDNLDGFQKLVSTWRTFSISISIGLQRRDHQAYLKFISQKYITRWISRHDSNDDWRFPIRKFCDFHRNFSLHSSVSHDTLEQFSVRTQKRHLKINIMKKKEK